jgi:hypothetical protein
MRRLLLLSAAGLFVVGSADAQNTTISPRDSMPSPLRQIVPTRIQVQMNISQRVMSDGAETQRRVEEAVRRSLYEAAMNECTVIMSVFKGGCRLASLNVNSNTQERNENGYFVNGNANGTYEIAVQP